MHKAEAVDIISIKNVISGIELVVFVSTIFVIRYTFFLHTPQRPTMEIEKTPASLLNELMAKIGIVPVYELSISDSNMFGMKIFDMKVTCDKVTATGSGKSKKEAKHHAAKAMLAKLNKDQVVVESIKESVSPSASLINATVNYVAELKVCMNFFFIKNFEITKNFNFNIITKKNHI